MKLIMKEIKFNGKLEMEIKPSGQGFVGIVKDLPIVVESSNQQQLAIDITKALATCFIHNPKAMEEFLAVDISA